MNIKANRDRLALMVPIMEVRNRGLCKKFIVDVSGKCTCLY